MTTPTWWSRLKSSGSIWMLCAVTCVFLLYDHAYVTHTADSKYSLLLSTSLIKDQSFDLKRYFSDMDRRHLPYQINYINNKYLYVYPPGPSLLSVPFIYLLDIFGKKIVDDDGIYRETMEIRTQKFLASLIVCLFLVSVFYTARMYLNAFESLIIMLVMGLGTTAFSSLSRGMWSDTWGVMFLGWCIFLFLRMEKEKKQVSIILFTTLLSWAFFCKPVYSISIVVFFAYFMLYRTRDVPVMVLTGFFWLSLFVAYSLSTFGTMVPYYYYLGLLRTNPIGSAYFLSALAGHLASPSRGLLVHSPWLLFVAYLLIRYGKLLMEKRFVLMALLILCVELILLSRWRMWWGGHSFGPRILSGMIPWIALLTISALAAWKMSFQKNAATRMTSLHIWNIAGICVATTLLAASIFIHGRGAFSWDVQMWNVSAQTELSDAEVWNWRNPQWAAGLKR